MDTKITEMSHIIQEFRCAMPKLCSWFDYKSGDCIKTLDGNTFVYLGLYRKRFIINVSARDLGVISISKAHDDWDKIAPFHIYLCGKFEKKGDDGEACFLISDYLINAFKLKGTFLRTAGNLMGFEIEDGAQRQVRIDRYMSDVRKSNDFWKLEWWDNDWGETCDDCVDDYTTTSSCADGCAKSYGITKDATRVIATKVLFNVVESVLRSEAEGSGEMIPSALELRYDDGHCDDENDDSGYLD